MVRLENLCKTFVMSGRRKQIADNINATFPTGASVALLGQNGAGKSSLLRIIAGTMDPTSGRVISTGTISWPVGFAGSFHPDLTGVQNVRFLARIYGVDTDELVDFVKDFAEVGEHFYLPLRTYSSGMRSRLAFGASMGMQFDTYLVDEVTAVGDAEFRRKSDIVLRERLEDSGAIIATHSMNLVRSLCDSVAVIHRGALTVFNDVHEGIAFYEEIGSGRQAKTPAARRPALASAGD